MGPERDRLWDRVSQLDSRVVDGLLALLLVAALQLQLAHGDYEGSGALNVFSSLALTLPLAFRRRAPLAVLVIFGATAIANEALGGALYTFPEEGAVDGEPPLFAALATGMVTFYSVGAHAPERRAIAGIVLGIACLWATVIVAGQSELASYMWSAGLIAGMPWFAGRVSRSRRQRIASLEREQEQRTQIALGDERARIARELHDIVAHSVGVIAVQAQGGRSVIDRDPSRAAEALESIERTARTALTDMRRSLGVLRGADGDAPARAPQPGVDDIDALVAEARRSGLAVELAIDGTPRPLPRGVDLSAYRIVQEALTNAIKHAGGAETAVTLRYRERELEIEVEDEGPGPSAGAEGREPGHGLIGMRERVAASGGELRTGRGARGGFVVQATLPLGE